MATKVSIIVPVYNTEKYLQQCLTSIINQTLCEFEVIVVDDGSKDASPRIIQSYMKKYPNLIYGIFQENKGQSSARNLALRQAKGEYVAFVDSDDFIGPKFLETLYEVASNKCSDMVICNYTKVTESGVKIKTFEANFTQEGVRIPSYISCNRLIRKELLDKYQIYYEEGVICEDIPFILKVEAVAQNVEIISTADYFYRTNPKSTTSSYRRKRYRMEQLPFVAMREAVEFCLDDKHCLDYNILELWICRIWTTFIFDIGKECQPDVQRNMSKEVTLFMRKYFPKCYQNSYINLFKFRKMSKVQKFGTWIFVQAFRIDKLYPAMKLYSLL